MEQNDVAFYPHTVFLLRLTDVRPSLSLLHSTKSALAKLRSHADSVLKQGSRGLDDESDDPWLGGRT